MGTIGADSHEGMVLSFLSQGQVKQSKEHQCDNPQLIWK
jgi:hypothetical protein